MTLLSMIFKNRNKNRSDRGRGSLLDKGGGRGTPLTSQTRMMRNMYLAQRRGEPVCLPTKNSNPTKGTKTVKKTPRMKDPQRNHRRKVGAGVSVEISANVEIFKKIALPHR